ncbi:MAG: transglutaminase domain-containing protein [Faecousia sp.]
MKKLIVFLLILTTISFTACGVKDQPVTDSTVESSVKGNEEASSSSETEISFSSETVAPSSEINAPKEPVITQINHYVLTPANLYYLTDAKMDAYKTAMDAIFAHESEVQLTDSYDDNLSVLGYLQESPYTFILSSYQITPDHKGMTFEYAYSAEECEQMLNMIDQEYLTLINETITEDMTDLEKVLAIYKYFAQRISYDYDWVEALNMSDDKYLFPDIVIYQALQNNKGVCHTYTYLCQFAFQQLGIACERASAEMQNSDSSHMWPLIWLDGAAFHIDPTWDDTGIGVSLRYFGLTDEENIDRGLVSNWNCNIDSALDIACTDTRFVSWRDIIDYNLIGNHQMEVTREDGTVEIIDLTQYQ